MQVKLEWRILIALICCVSDSKEYLAQHSRRWSIICRENKAQGSHISGEVLLLQSCIAAQCFIECMHYSSGRLHIANLNGIEIGI